jgi:hypothetical protein
LQALLEDAILSQEAIARTLLPKDDPLLDELIEEFNADKDRMECVLKTLGILRGGADEACGYVACHHITTLHCVVLISHTSLFVQHCCTTFVCFVRNHLTWSTG